MIDMAKIIKGLESLRNICNAKSNMAIGNSKAAWAGYANTADDAIALLKEQENIVRCKECKHRGNSEKCVLSALSEEKDFQLFMLDNRGNWFCGDGERR